MSEITKFSGRHNGHAVISYPGFGWRNYVLYETNAQYNDIGNELHRSLHGAKNRQIKQRRQFLSAFRLLCGLQDHVLNFFDTATLTHLPQGLVQRFDQVRVLFVEIVIEDIQMQRLFNDPYVAMPQGDITRINPR